MTDPHPGLPRDSAEDADHAAIRRLIEAWGFRRDGAEWDALLETFHQDGTIAVSWYAGSFDGFVTACRANRGKSFSKHVMCGSRVTVNGVEFTGQTNMRFLDRISRHDDEPWRILQRVAIYDHDTMAPAIPGTPSSVEAEGLLGLPPGYRFLAWRLRAAGRAVPDDLPGPGSEAEATLRREADAWLAA